MTKILLADDSVTIQKVVELTFSDEESRVITAGDGATALERIRSDRPDIILSDVNMPGMNGYELCQQVKTDSELGSIPFLFLKGTFESFDEDKARQCGADGFMVKPFESQELIRKVKELVEKSSAAAPPHLAVPPAGETPVQLQTFGQPPPSSLQLNQGDIAEGEVTPAQRMHTTEGTASPPAQGIDAPPSPPAAKGEGESLFDLGEDTPPPGGASRPEEQEDDLWSEVSLRDSASPLLEDSGLEEETFWGVGGDEPADAGGRIEAPAGEDLLEEIGEPDILDLTDDAEVAQEFQPAEEREASPGGRALERESEAEFPEEAPAAVLPVGSPAEAEQVFEAEPQPEPAAMAEEIAPQAEHDEEMAKVISAKIEEVVRDILGPAISETAARIIEEVAWDVIPELAEAMIKSEIERITKREGGRGDT